MPDYTKSEYDDRRAEAIARRDMVRRETQNFERQMHGDFAQGIAAKRMLEGDFKQKAGLQREIHGTFPQRAAQEQLVHGTYPQRSAQEREIQGTLAERQAGDMAKLQYQYGPGSLEERKFTSGENLAQQKLGLEGRHMDLLGDYYTTQKKKEWVDAMGNIHNNAVKLFPDDPGKARAYIDQEMGRVRGLFPEFAPKLPGKDTLAAPGSALPQVENPTVLPQGAEVVGATEGVSRGAIKMPGGIIRSFDEAVGNVQPQQAGFLPPRQAIPPSVPTPAQKLRGTQYTTAPDPTMMGQGVSRISNQPAMPDVQMGQEEARIAAKRRATPWGFTY